LTPGAVKRHARHLARQLRSVKDDLAVNNHGRESYSVLMRRLKGRLIADRALVKDDQVCGKAFADLAAVAEVERLGRKRRHFADGVLKGNDLKFADVTAEHSCIVAVAARVRHA